MESNFCVNCGEVEHAFILPTCFVCSMKLCSSSKCCQSNQSGKEGTCLFGCFSVLLSLFVSNHCYFGV
jgi:hypothetical protein